MSIYSESNQENPHCPVFEVQRTNNKHEFRLKGTKNDDNSVSLTLRIADTCGEYLVCPLASLSLFAIFVSRSRELLN